MARAAGSHSITLFISTGRCGTQWLASALSAAYGDLAAVTHEPIWELYRPRDFFRRYGSEDEVAAVPEVNKHLHDVEKALRKRDYIETGWPLFAAVPTFLQRFPLQVRLVHLVRHPVDAARSLAGLGLYSRQPKPGDYSHLGLLDPMNGGARLPQYATRWPEMSEYERCLYRWAEINLFAAELHDRYTEPAFTRVRMEDMFNPASSELDRLVAFLGLPPRPSLAASRERQVDVHGGQASTPYDASAIREFPEVLVLMEEYGYRLEPD